MQKTCTNTEEFSISLYSGTKCTLWDLIKKKNVNCHAWSNRIDYCYNNSMNAFIIFSRMHRTPYTLKYDI